MDSSILAWIREQLVQEIKLGQTIKANCQTTIDLNRLTQMLTNP